MLSRIRYTCNSNLCVESLYTEVAYRDARVDKIHALKSLAQSLMVMFNSTCAGTERQVVVRVRFLPVIPWADCIHPYDHFFATLVLCRHKTLTIAYSFVSTECVPHGCVRLQTLEQQGMLQLGIMRTPCRSALVSWCQGMELAWTTLFTKIGRLLLGFFCCTACSSFR